MGALGFIASVIDSLAWPAVVVILVLALQAPLDKLLPELKRFRYGKVEIDFGREVRELEARARTAGLHVPQRPASTKAEAREPTEIINDAARLAADFPEPTVMLAWTAVEHEITQAVIRLGIAADDRRYGAPARSIALLHERGYLDNETHGLLNRMRNLRNAAAHASREMVQILPMKRKSLSP